MEKSNFKDLINKAKSNNTVKSIQIVTPIKLKQNTEVQFSFYIEKQLLKQVKLIALEKDLSIKSIINIAINEFIEKGKRIT